MNTEEMKAIVASYWRYDRQCPIIAFEADSNLWSSSSLADVLAITKDDQLIETEIKASVKDFRRDHLKQKHKFFMANDRHYPTAYFYFAVPLDIANKVSLMCDHRYPYAGVLGVVGLNNVAVHRNPKRLSGQISKDQIKNLVRAQSATVCRLAQKVAELKGTVDNLIAERKKANESKVL